MTGSPDAVPHGCIRRLLQHRLPGQLAAATLPRPLEAVHAGGQLGRLGVDVQPPLLQVVLPVGISFFTFHALSYVIDVFRGDAIGCALLLGFRFPRNFDAPYTARSVQEFWRRWHMTLSRWLRDYLYIPLGGNRGSPARVKRTLMLTMLLGGLWHGAAWTFVIWGGIHGAAMLVERHLAERHLAGRRASGPGRGNDAVRWFVTFHVVCLAWVFFRAESLGAVQGAQVAFSRLTPAMQGVALALGLSLVGALAPAGVAPFIYFQF